MLELEPQSHSRESAFRPDPRNRWTFPSATTEESFARLLHVVSERRGVALLSGSEGLGKTHLLRQLERSLGRSGMAVQLVDAAGLDARRLQARLTTALGITPRLGDSLADWRRWEMYLDGRRATDSRQVVLLDNIDRAHITARSFLETWLSVCEHSCGVLTTLCAARNQDVWHELRGARAWGELRIGLVPWTESETAEFILAEWHRTQATPSPFSVAALFEIHRATGGIPHQILDLCRHCVTVTRAENLESVDVPLVRSICSELLRRAA